MAIFSQCRWLPAAALAWSLSVPAYAYASPPQPVAAPELNTSPSTDDEFSRLCRAVKEATREVIDNPKKGIDALDEALDAIKGHKLALANDPDCRQATLDGHVAAARVMLEHGMRRAASELIDEAIRSAGGQPLDVSSWGSEIELLYADRVKALGARGHGHIQVECPAGCRVIVESTRTGTTISPLPLGDYRMRIESTSGQGDPHEEVVSLTKAGATTIVTYPPPERELTEIEIEIQALEGEIRRLERTLGLRRVELEQKRDFIDHQEGTNEELEQELKQMEAKLWRLRGEVEARKKTGRLRQGANASLIMGSFAGFVSGLAFASHAGTHYVRDNLGSNPGLRNAHNAMSPVALATGSVCVGLFLIGAGLHIAARKKESRLAGRLSLLPGGVGLRF